jgi:hypothetical protein
MHLLLLDHPTHLECSTVQRALQPDITSSSSLTPGTESPAIHQKGCWCSDSQPVMIAQTAGLRKAADTRETRLS